ncbi:acetylpyruvate hydrolase [Malassezia pachydermatis]
MQDKVKKAGLPWSAAKGFDTFTPIRYVGFCKQLMYSDLIAKEKISDPHNVNLWLKVDGETRQSGNTSDMIFSIPRLISHVSSIMTLEQGDVMLTGTPKGVSQLKDGQTVTCGLGLPGSPSSLAELKFLVKNRVGGYAFEG